MPRSENQKKKLILILRLLQKRSDEDHPVSMQEILAYLSGEGVEAERKSIYDDLEALRDLGYDIINVKGRNGGYFLGNRDFEQAELKILVDAVQASRFITRQKSRDLIRKISELGGEYGSRELKRDVYVLNRAKSENESTMYSVDAIHSALRDDRIVKFKYMEYGMDKKLHYRKNGAFYTVAPLGLIWNNERYYLIAHDPSVSEIRHYRVDRMKNISVAKERRDLPTELRKFDVGEYGARNFSMFSGEESYVTVTFPKEMVNTVIDQFGLDVSIFPQDEDTFKARFKVAVSKPFFGWIFSLGNKVRIEGPENVKEEYISYLKVNLRQYR